MGECQLEGSDKAYYGERGDDWAKEGMNRPPRKTD